MDRTIYKYNVDFIIAKLNTTPKTIDMNEELKNVFDFLIALPKEKLKYDMPKSDKLLYLDEYKYENSEAISYFYLKLVSLKYNQVREVVNKDTFENKGILKNRSDGDKEYNHIIIIKENTTLKAVFEYNYWGVTNFSTIIAYLNEQIAKYYNNINMPQLFHLESNFVVNKDFLKELNTVEKINSISVIIGKKRIGSTVFGDHANRDEILEDIEIKFKIDKRKPIPTDIINELYEKKDEKQVKSIKIQGRNSSNKIKLDSEEMKEKRIITVKEDELGLAKSDEVFYYMKKYIKGE